MAWTGAKAYTVLPSTSRADPEHLPTTTFCSLVFVMLKASRTRGYVPSSLSLRWRMRRSTGSEVSCVTTTLTALSSRTPRSPVCSGSWSQPVSRRPRQRADPVHGFHAWHERSGRRERVEPHVEQSTEPQRARAAVGVFMGEGSRIRWAVDHIELSDGRTSAGATNPADSARRSWAAVAETGPETQIPGAVGRGCVFMRYRTHTVCRCAPADKGTEG